MHVYTNPLLMFSASEISPPKLAQLSLRMSFRCSNGSGPLAHTSQDDFSTPLFAP